MRWLFKWVVKCLPSLVVILCYTSVSNAYGSLSGYHNTVHPVGRDVNPEPKLLAKVDGDWRIDSLTVILLDGALVELGPATWDAELVAINVSRDGRVRRIEFRSKARMEPLPKP